jgi:hypothetical protein
MKLLKKLLRFVSRKKSKFSKVCEGIENFSFPEDSNIFLIAFSYDIPTKQTFTWIKDFLKKSNKQERIYRFHDDGFKKSELAESLLRENNRVEIFCGHGEIKGLNGPPYSSLSPDIFKDRHSIIYDSEMINSGLSSMFAFCCNAGKTFGSEFTAIKGNTFIGFKGEIPFVTELYDDLKYIFQIIAKDVIEKGQVGIEHEIMFIREIDELIENVDKYKNPDIIGL